MGPVVIFIQCAACKGETPATDNEGTPDIPADWFALCPESDPGFELYACSTGCSLRVGRGLALSFPGDCILERRVMSEAL